MDSEDDETKPLLIGKYRFNAKITVRMVSENEESGQKYYIISYESCKGLYLFTFPYIMAEEIISRLRYIVIKSERLYVEFDDEGKIYLIKEIYNYDVSYNLLAYW